MGIEETQTTGLQTIPKPFNDDTAVSYVRALFEHVLGRQTIGVEELQYWKRYLVENQDSAELLRLFATSDENIKRKQPGSSDSFPSGHFYSPIVDTVEIQKDAQRVFSVNLQIADIDLNLNGQEEIFERLSLHASTLPFRNDPADGIRYHFDNTSYGFGDAFAYWGMVSEYKPQRIIEVGCGYTSALALDALDILRLESVCTFIDPFPELLKRVAAPIDPRHRIIEDRVQSLNPSIVDELGKNDFLFIDSSHVVKTGSDVHFEIFELLPRLNRGVIVHFHDMFYPFEYPKNWIIDERKSWNELYFLRAFLMYNTKFEILYFNDCFAKLRAASLNILPAEVARRIFLNPGGGLWLRRL